MCFVKFLENDAAFGRKNLHFIKEKPIKIFRFFDKNIQISLTMQSILVKWIIQKSTITMHCSYNTTEGIFYIVRYQALFFFFIRLLLIPFSSSVQNFCDIYGVLHFFKTSKISE